MPHKCQSATPPWGGAPALALVTGLSNKWVDRVHLLLSPAELRFVAVALCRVPRSLGRQFPYLAACYITGTLLIAIEVPFV